MPPNPYRSPERKRRPPGFGCLVALTVAFAVWFVLGIAFNNGGIGDQGFGRPNPIGPYIVVGTVALALAVAWGRFLKGRGQPPKG